MEPTWVNLRRCRHGTTVVWLIMCFMTLVAFISFGVDFGRMQVAKSEIQAATDAAVRAAGQKFIEGGSMGQMLSAAVGAASDNTVDGVPVTVRMSNLKLGVYEPSARRFTETSDMSVCNSVRIELEHRFGSDGPNLSFLGLLSSDEFKVRSRATIMSGDVPAGFDSYSYTVTTPGMSGGSPGSVVTETTVVDAYTPTPTPTPTPAPAPDPTPTAVTAPFTVSPPADPTPATPDPTPAVTTTTTTTPDTTWSTPGSTTTVTVTTPAPAPRRTMVQVD
jgi:hypothetical protein